MIYLTYNDQPSGIYNSQVIDVVNYVNKIQRTEKVKLLALISFRSFFKNRKLIKHRLPGSTVLPMIPKAGLWRLNYFILFFFVRDKKVMARGAFAASLALRLKRTGRVEKVIFDARGAYKAELNEYNVVPDANVKQEISEIEKNVVSQADYRLAVSEALVNYWKKEFGYTSHKHVVIPCTLSNDFKFQFPAEAELKKIKFDLGFNENDIVIVYSGSSAGWQSFSLVEKILDKILAENFNVKLLWLTDDLNENSEFVKRFRGRIKSAWVKHSEVKKYLLAGDFGLLYRENSVTNQVASPVKFAEYLSCGLNVIISEGVGDFSEFVRKNKCGTVGSVFTISSVGYTTKTANHNLAMQYLQKENYLIDYLKLLSF